MDSLEKPTFQRGIAILEIISTVLDGKLSEIEDDILDEVVFYRSGWNFEREQTTTFVVSRSNLKTEDGRRSRERGAGREKERERENAKEEGEKAGRWNGIQQSVRHSASRIASFRRYKSRPFAQEYIRETPSASSCVLCVSRPLSSPRVRGLMMPRIVFLLV